MTRRRIARFMTSALAGLAIALTSARAPADAIQIEWDFVGTVHWSGDYSQCCVPTFPADGSQVTGKMVFLYQVGGPGREYNASVDGYESSLSASGFCCTTDGAPGSPDQLSTLEYLGNVPPEFGVQPGWSPGGLTQAAIHLIDLDGVAFGPNPRTGDVIPDHPPADGVFETANFSLFEDFSSDANPSGPRESFAITVTMDHWLPEPGAAALALTGLAALLALRPSAARSPRSGRGRARRDSGDPVTPE
jgi:hypothetical protein